MEVKKTPIFVIEEIHLQMINGSVFSIFMFDFGGGGGGVVPTDIAFTKQKFAVAVANSLAYVLKVC